MATGESFNYLPAGPILGLPLAMQAQEQHSNADRRIRGKKNSNSLRWRIILFYYARKKGQQKDCQIVYIWEWCKFGDKDRFDKEQIGVKEPFPVTKCQFTS